MRTKRGVAFGILALAVTACAEGGGLPSSSAEETGVTFGPIETRLLDPELVSFSTSARGAQSPDELRAVTDCAAAQYALIRGYSYARHIRTNLDASGAVWSADAAYTISKELPRGEKVLDAADTLAACQVLGLPTF